MSERNVKENKMETGELADKFAVVMSEFAPISIYLVISPLVSLILLGDARSRFDIRFYLVSILFIILDLEVTFFFPWAVSHNKMGLFGFWSMMAFLLILTIGSFYEWERSAWAWKSSVKSTLCMIRVTFLTYLFHILISLIFFIFLGSLSLPFVTIRGTNKAVRTEKATLASAHRNPVELVLKEKVRQIWRPGPPRLNHLSMSLLLMRLPPRWTHRR